MKRLKQTTHLVSISSDTICQLNQFNTNSEAAMLSNMQFSLFVIFLSLPSSTMRFFCYAIRIIACDCFRWSSPVIQRCDGCDTFSIDNLINNIDSRVKYSVKENKKIKSQGMAPFGQIYTLFGVLFTGLNSVVVFQNCQISVVPVPCGFSV